jgi:hypothetical protein
MKRSQTSGSACPVVQALAHHRPIGATPAAANDRVLVSWIWYNLAGAAHMNHDLDPPIMVLASELCNAVLHSSYVTVLQ